MTVKRVSPKELTSDIVFRLNHLYHARSEEFVAMTDRKEETLLVNKKVPKKDIDGFLEVIMFPGYEVADYETKTGDFLEYVYKKYGFHTYRALIDAHTWRMDQEAKRIAKERAEEILPLIEKEVNSENPIVEYDEFLASEVREYGHHLGDRTMHKITNYSHIYEFYFGYLLGAGIIKI